MKITHLKLGQVGTSSVSKRHVTPNSGSEGDIRENGIARAKECARGFSDLSTSLFPVRDNAAPSRRL